MEPEGITLVDTHAHLDDGQFTDDLEDVIARAGESGIDRIVTVGTDIGTSERAIELASSHEGIYASVGFHAHDAHSFGPAELDRLRELCAQPKVVAVGETGLDFFRDYSPRDDQIRAFRDQIELAIDVDLPLVIHSRKAESDCMRMLEEYRGRVRGVAHCFSGSAETAGRFLHLGLYVSFAGTVTFPNATALAEIAKTIPDDRIVVETDCPYLAPQQRRGTRNEPAYVRFTAAGLAGLRGTDLATIARLTTENARRLFGIA